MKFSPETVEIGAKVVIPDSLFGPAEGEVVAVTEVAVTVAYPLRGQRAVGTYSFGWLNAMYGGSGSNGNS